MRELLRVRDFRILLAGQIVSMFGDTVFLLGLGIWTKELTGSNAIAGSVILATWSPVWPGRCSASSSTVFHGARC